MNKKIIALLLTAFIFTNVNAVTLKFGVIAPEGTSWAQHLNKSIDEINKATEGRVKFKIYYGGTQGDEPDVLRKIRVGHLQGGIFSGKTLGEINGDVRVMEVPFTFLGDRQKAFSTLEKMTPFFNKKFEEKGFINLGFFEVGLVYLLSKKEVMSVSDLKGVKIWAWEGDPVAESFINYLKMVPVPLASTDVLSSLSTGIIDATYGPSVGFVAMQWYTNANYVVDFPVTYSVAAFVVDQKAWKKVKKADQDKIIEICNRNLKGVNDANIKDNEDSIEVLKSFGIKYTKFNDEDIKHVKEMRKAMLKTLTGKVFSAETLKAFEGFLK